MLKVVFATSEMVPFAKTGGLADVAGSLPSELADLGHEVKVFMPKYSKIDENKFGLKLVYDSIKVPMDTGDENAGLFVANFKGVQVFFIDNPEYFSREQLYGTPQGDYPDNDRRFTFFQRAVPESIKAINFKPDVMHCHDWQTGLLPLYLKTIYKDEPLFQKTKTFFTIHNLAYQGNFPPDSLSVTGLPWDVFSLDGLEFWGKLSFLKAGLVYSDVLTTVSEKYAEEIQTKEMGCGMEGVLSNRSEDLHGVLNGIDMEVWNPETDRNITANFSAKDLTRKLINKAVLQKENSLPVNSSIPLLGIITRLADQKGLDILAPAMEDLAKMDIQFVLLGTGEEKYHKIFSELGKKYPEKFGMNILFDAKMAQRIYAGSDMFLMPSYFEPCGLGQMISLRYGTVPVVRATGGLADTITNYDPSTGKGNGFVFSDYTSSALLDAISRAIEVFQDRRAWLKLVKEGMKRDFSWEASAKKYISLYKEALKKKPQAALQS